MFILFISNAFSHTHTNLSACLVLYPNFARIRVSSFRNTPVCVCVCVCTKCARKFFPACYFHYFPAGVVCVYGGKGNCAMDNHPTPRFHYFSLRVGSFAAFVVVAVVLVMPQINDVCN